MNHDPVPPARHDGTLHVPEEHVPEERLFKARLSLDGYVARFAVKDNKKPGRLSAPVVRLHHHSVLLGCPWVSPWGCEPLSGLEPLCGAAPALARSTTLSDCSEADSQPIG